MRVSWAATIAAILLVSQAAVAGAIFPKVVVAPAPLKPYVDALLEGMGESQSLMQPGQDAHEFALAPRQAQMLASADMIIVPDLRMNRFLKKLLANNKRAKIIELTALAGAEPLPYADGNPWTQALKIKPEAPKKGEKKDEAKDEKKKPVEDMPLTDPHIWLDPVRMARIATPLAEAMGEFSPESRAGLKANASRLSTHLHAEVVPALREMLSKTARTSTATTRPEIPFITYHSAYQYFMQRFGLTRGGELMQRPEETVGAKSKAAMLAAAGNGIKVRCIIGEQRSVLMDRVAKSTGARVVLLSPEQLVPPKSVDSLSWMANDYDRFLYTTAKAFADCL